MALAMITSVFSYADVAINSTNFPNETFRNQVKLKDLNKDGILSTAEAAVVKKVGSNNDESTLGIFTRSITDLTGIKYFFNLEEFGFTGIGSMEIPLTKDLDLSGLTKLKQVVFENPLNSKGSFKILLNNCTALERLSIKRITNPITFDVKGCTNLEEIEYCDNAGSIDNDDFDFSSTAQSNPKLRKITVSNNYYLKRIYISCPTVKELILTNNCNYQGGKGQTITIGACSNAEIIDISKNHLTQLMAQPNQFPKIREFDCSYNNITADMPISIYNAQYLLADPDAKVYFGNQQGQNSVTVRMSEAQKANFDASNEKNKFVNVNIVNGPGGSISTDKEAPVVNFKDLILYISPDRKSFRVQWNPATDNKTAAKDISYSVYVTTASQKNLLDDPVANRLPAINGESGPLTNVDSYQCYEYSIDNTIKNLKDRDRYYFTVVATDAAGNYTCYNTGYVFLHPANLQIAPNIPDGTLTAKVNDSRSSINLSWGTAYSQATVRYELNYYVYLVPASEKGWLPDALVNFIESNSQEGPLRGGDYIFNYDTNIYSTDYFHQVSGLSDGEYAATVVVMDEYGNYAYYDTVDILVSSSDVNRDHTINSVDVVSVYNYIATGEASKISQKRADTNGDSKVNSTDIITIYNTISGNK